MKTKTNAQKEYTSEAQQAARIASQIDPADGFWAEVDSHLQKRKKARQGLVQERPKRDY